MAIEKIGLLDLGGTNEPFWVQTENDIQNKVGLSYNGMKLLKTVVSYLSRKGFIVPIYVVGAKIEYGKGYHVEDKNYVESDDYPVRVEKILKTLDGYFQDCNFIISTMNEFTTEIVTIAEWCDKHEKLYFVSVYDEGDIELMKEDGWKNVVIIARDELTYESELLAVDCAIAIQTKKEYIINKTITTTDGIPLKNKLFSKGKIKEEEEKMLRIRLSNLNNDSMIESIDHLLYEGRWSERVEHETLGEAIRDLMEWKPEKFREYMFYVALEDILKQKIKDSVKIAMNEEYSVVKTIPVVNDVLIDMHERKIIDNYNLKYEIVPTSDEGDFSEHIDILYWLDAEKEYKFEIFY